MSWVQNITNKMSVEIPSGREDDEKQNLAENEDSPSYSSDQDTLHLPTSSLPTASAVPLTMLPIQEPDQFYPVPSRKLHVRITVTLTIYATI